MFEFVSSFRDHAHMYVFPATGLLKPWPWCAKLYKKPTMAQIVMCLGNSLFLHTHVGHLAHKVIVLVIPTILDVCACVNDPDSDATNSVVAFGIWRVVGQLPVRVSMKHSPTSPCLIRSVEIQPTGGNKSHRQRSRTNSSHRPISMARLPLGVPRHAHILGPHDRLNEMVARRNEI